MGRYYPAREVKQDSISRYFLFVLVKLGLEERQYCI